MSSSRAPRQTGAKIIKVIKPVAEGCGLHGDDGLSRVENENA
jgi:hypothetical protein